MTMPTIDTLTEAQQHALDALSVAAKRGEAARRSNVTEHHAITTPTIHYRVADQLVELGLAEQVADDRYQLVDQFDAHLQAQGIDPATMDDSPELPAYLVFVTDQDGQPRVAATETAKARAVKLARGLTAESYGPVVVTTADGHTVDELDGELELPEPEAATPAAREPGDRWGRGHLRAPRTHAVVSDDVDYRADRIPAGATHHVCEACSEELPITRYPTTSDGSRRTECRSCRDARRAASV